MAPRLSGQTSIFGVVIFVSMSLLRIERQKKLKKFTFLTRKPRSHVRILIYRMWAIRQWLVLLKETRICSTSIFVGDIWKHSLRYLGPKQWNDLTSGIKKLPSLKQFKSVIRKS